MLTTLAIYFAVPSMHQLITPAINTLMATNPDIKVRPDALLNMIRKISAASPSFNHSTEIARVNAALKFGKKDQDHNFNEQLTNRNIPRSNKVHASSQQPAYRTFNPNLPCHYCGETGHWLPKCPIKAKVQQRPVNIAGMGVLLLLEDHEAFLDSGATHLVVGDISLFTSLQTTDMILSIASSESFEVNGIGTVFLKTLQGSFQLNNVLYCCNIPGVILSLCHLLKEGSSILFLNDSFIISSKYFNIPTFKKNNQWFIHLNYSINKPITNTALSSAISFNNSTNMSQNYDSVLWNSRIGPLLIRHLKHMKKSNAIIGIPNISLHDIKLCHDFSISKSQHRSVKTASRQLVNQPGDLIVADLMEAIISENKVEWIHAINEEIESLATEKAFTTFNLCDALKEVPNKSILRTKWVFTKKPEQFKARSVVHVFRQIHGINYNEMFAPIPMFNSLRLLFSTACFNRWRAARCWWLHLKKFLFQIGFTNKKEDLSTYTFNLGDDQAILWVHVDDGALTASSNALMNKLVEQLNSYLKIKWNDDINGLVGISIDHTEEGYKFWQPDLIDKLTNLVPSNIVAKTPLPANCHLESYCSEDRMDKSFLRRIGILLYIAQVSHPDIAYVVNYLACFSLKTDQLHWHALEHLIAYLRGTRNMGILIANSNSSSEMRCFVDASWGGKGN
ncbi:hypothetical protein O181_077316 [Austropuccinia psidii MF-1]|uniref:CCHC-type domain-containing protein n=1 Tax=Austropuccinia psidii MF-1 TaxID=1389203 RepID=A0A9Q3FC37_9BASI|nr:hypothetical protein [Austropuccinia psidii MF-1]